MSGLSAERIRPSAVLAPFVDDLRIITPVAEHAIQRVERLPDGMSSLVFRRGEHDDGEVCLAGARRRALVKEVRPAALSVVVRFAPGGAAAFFSIPASEMTDRVLGLEELWGTDAVRLRERLASARDPRDVLALLQEALNARVRVDREASASARLARRAVRLLGGVEREAGGERDSEAGAWADTPTRVREIAATLGVSDRHLRRAFESTVGVSPKEFVRMVRLQRAIRTATRARSHAPAPAWPWSDIAAHAGYYDQAHMIAEFHELIGATPTAFLRHGVDRSLRLASPACRAL